MLGLLDLAKSIHALSPSGEVSCDSMRRFVKWVTWRSGLSGSTEYLPITDQSPATPSCSPSATCSGNKWTGSASQE